MWGIPDLSDIFGGDEEITRDFIETIRESLKEAESVDLEWDRFFSDDCWKVFSKKMKNELQALENQMGEIEDPLKFNRAQGARQVLKLILDFEANKKHVLEGIKSLEEKPND